MDARADQNEDQWYQPFEWNTELYLKDLCVLGVSLINSLEKFPAIFPVLRMRKHLIHEPVILSMFFHGPVRNLVNELPQLLALTRSTK